MTHHAGWFTAAGTLLVAILAGGSYGATTEPDPQLAPVTQRPCLLIEAQALPSLIERLKAQAKRPGGEKLPRAIAGLIQSDTRRSAATAFMAEVREHLGGDPAVKFSPVNNRYGGLRRARRFNELLYEYDLIAAWHVLTPQEEQEFKQDAIAAASFLIGDNPAKFPSPECPHKNGLEFPTGHSTCNRWPDYFMGAALVGMNFPEHPLAKAWVRYAIGQVRYMLPRGNWDGAWNEVPRYHNWTMIIFAPFFQALKQRTGVNFFQDPNTRQLVDWYVRFSSPLVRFPELTHHNPAGEPTLPVWGDSSYGNSFGACGLYAPQYQQSDPAFSRRLMWMWQRAGGPGVGGQNATAFALMCQAELPAEPQKLGSAMCRTFGYLCLRAGFDTPEETVVYMRGGRKGVTHPRSDLGSIDLFSHGFPLVLGSASGPYESTAIEWNRSQESNNGVIVGPHPRDRKESSGQLISYLSHPQFDYAVSDCSRPRTNSVREEEAFLWRRHLLLVKSPAYLVIWDEMKSSQSAEWVLHTTAKRYLWQPHQITAQTDFGVELDVHVLAPQGELSAREFEGRFGEIEEDPSNPASRKHSENAYPFSKLKYLKLPAAAGESFLTLLYPHKAGKASVRPTLTSRNAQHVTLQVASDAGVDQITLGRDGGSFTRPGSPAVVLPMSINGDQ